MSADALTDSPAGTPRITLKGAIIGALGAALLCGIVPACLTLDYRLTNAMERRARESLARVPKVVAAQMAEYSDALAAHANDFPGVPSPGGAGAAAAGDNARVARALSGLTRSGVVVLGARGAIASTLDTTATRAVERAAATGQLSATAADIGDGARTLIAVRAPFDSVGSIVFTRPLDSELAGLPELRRILAFSSTSAILVALVLGVILASRIANPVRELSIAARAAEAGDFGAPLPASRVQEVETLSAAFASMRQSLSGRLDELRAANTALIDRTARVTALQAEFMQRDRLSAASRLVAQLAHEIRNPIASLRNCLEVIRRRVAYDPEAREFADLAIDELLRMHELAERMMDLNRPRDSGMERCRPLFVAREVARLSIAGTGSDLLTVDIQGDDRAEAAIAPDALKQVLLNLVQNAREAFEAWSAKPAGPARVTIGVAHTDKDVVVEVRDNGPGIPTEVLPRVFDPFFTTKGAVHGVGLGLFVAEGLVRSAGGRITAGNASEDVPEQVFAVSGGAWFRVRLPSASPAYGAVANPAHASV